LRRRFYSAKRTCGASFPLTSRLADTKLNLLQGEWRQIFPERNLADQGNRSAEIGEDIRLIIPIIASCQ
jgi:hypothetical protein